MKARVIVTLKSGVLDPQGKAIEGALKALGVDGLTSVRQGKMFDIEIDGERPRGRAPDARARPARGCSPTRSSRTTRSRSAEGRMRAAVILFPGFNREGDAARALKQATGATPAIVWHAERDLPAGTDLVVLPGGFSYGDYLRCGAIAARAPIMKAVRAHAARGGLVLGICNGFQILCEAGLLPGVLMRNAERRFLCKMQHLRVENAQTPFTAPLCARTGRQIRHRPRRGQFRRRRRDDRANRGRGTGRVPLLRRRGPGRRRANPNGSTHPSPAYSTSGSTCSG